MSQPPEEREALPALPHGYLLAKAAMVVPLLEEARDALTALTEAQRVRFGISKTLADRMDIAGTYSLDDWLLREGASPEGPRPRGSVAEGHSTRPEGTRPRTAVSDIDEAAMQRLWANGAKAWAGHETGAERVAAEPAIKRYREICADGAEPEEPIERLRFFCAQAMSSQDWLDVEPFFEALEAPVEHLASVEALRELVAVRDLRERITAHKPQFHWSRGQESEFTAMQREYEERKPLAWAAARAALTIKPAAADAEGNDHG